jgi:hypothetical protein
MIARETIYAALFALVSTAPGLRKSSRRLVSWDDIADTDQPALFQVQTGENAKFATHLPTIWTLRCDLVLYAKNSGQDSAIASSLLNPIIDSIVAALLPSPVTFNEQTLGGLVTRCRIEGEIVTVEGVLGNQSIVVIPVTMFAPQ